MEILKKESDKERASRDEQQRELIEKFQQRMQQIDKDIQEQAGKISAQKEREIKEVVEALKEDVSEEELVSILKDAAPSFKYIPPQSFGEIDEPN